MNSTKLHFILGQDQRLVSTLSHLPLWQTSKLEDPDEGRSESAFMFRAPGEKAFSLQPKPSVNAFKLPEHVVGFWPSLLSSSATPSHEWPSLAVAPSMVKRLDPIWQERSSKRPVWQLGSSGWLQMAPLPLDPAHYPHLPEPPEGEEAAVSGGEALHFTPFMPGRCVNRLKKWQNLKWKTCGLCLIFHKSSVFQ